MKEQLLLLIALQESDSQLAKLKVKHKDLPEKIKKLDEDLRLFKEDAEKNKRKYEELKARHVEGENKIKKINESMVRAREKMLEVKNNKEYQAMLKEIEAAEAARSDLETDIIKVLEEIDSLAIQVKRDEAVFAEYKKKHEEEKKLLENELNSLDASFAACDQRRADLRKEILPDIMALYEKIKNRNGGLGVTYVWKAICNGCHMNIPPQLYIDLQKSSEIMYCPNCNRIIYYQNREKSA